MIPHVNSVLVKVPSNVCTAVGIDKSATLFHEFGAGLNPIIASNTKSTPSTGLRVSGKNFTSYPEAFVATILGRTAVFGLNGVIVYTGVEIAGVLVTVSPPRFVGLACEAAFTHFA